MSQPNPKSQSSVRLCGNAARSLASRRPVRARKLALNGWFILLAGLAAIVPLPSLAQLVADGATNTISGFTTNLIGDLIIGTNAPFTRLIIQNAGVVTNSGDAYLGYNFTSDSNRVDVAGANSSWRIASNLWVGRISGGRGNRLVITNGATVSCYQGTLGYEQQNTVEVSGTGSAWTMQSDLAVGDSALTNQLLISQGGKVADSTGYIGTGSRYNSPESHLVLVTDPSSVWSNSSRLYVGDWGDYNQLVISNGGMVINTDGFIGYNASWTSNNTVTVTGAGSVWNNWWGLTIGYYSSGNRLVIAAGGSVSNDAAYLGRLVYSSNNTATVTGQNSVWDCAYNLLVGHSGPSNRLEITDGGKVRSSSGHVGFNFNTSNNTAVVSGPNSAWVMQTNLWVGYAGESNRLTVSDSGTVQARVMYVGYFSESNQNLALIDGGTLYATNLVDIRRGRLVLQSGLLSTAALWLTNGPNCGLILNGGTVKSGSTIHQTGSPLAVGGGAASATYELVGSGTHQFAGGLLVASNGLLRGSGNISGNVTVGGGGTVSPGLSLGQLAVNGALVLSNGSTTVMELDAAAGTNDCIVGLTSVIYGGTLQVANTAGILTNGSRFGLFTAGSYSGSFSSLAAPSPGPGLKWNTSQLNVDGTLRVVPQISPAPAITQATLASGGLVLSADGGVAYDPCYLLTSTNLSAASANWLRIATNFFDSQGRLSLTNTIVSTEGRRFFRLAVD
jgi:fibronectin-binding autotransporter adhesin